MRRARDLRDQKDRDAAATVAGVLRAKPVVVSARAGSEGRLFGSVTASDLAEAIEAQTGAVVDRRRIDLSEPIRSIGTHTVNVRLHSDVEAEVVVEVEPDQLTHLHATLRACPASCRPSEVIHS